MQAYPIFSFRDIIRFRRTFLWSYQSHRNDALSGWYRERNDRWCPVVVVVVVCRIRAPHWIASTNVIIVIHITIIIVVVVVVVIITIIVIEIVVIGPHEQLVIDRHIGQTGCGWLQQSHTGIHSYLV